MTKTISKWKLILPIAIITAILAIGIAAAVYYLSPANYLSLDVNPSIELQTNRLNQVVSVNPVNEDAKQILTGYELTDRNLETVIRNIVDRMVLYGYIASDKDNEILISADEKNSAITLSDTVNSIITTYLNEKQLAGNTILQTVNATDEELQASHDNNVSVGKMRLIKSLMANDSALTMEELSGLRISELLALSANKNSTMIAAATDAQGDGKDLEETDKEAAYQSNEDADGSDEQGINEDADGSDEQGITEDADESDDQGINEAAGKVGRQKEDAEEGDSDYEEAHASKNQSKYEDADNDSDEGNNEDADVEDGQSDIDQQDNHSNKHSIKKEDQEDNQDSEDAYISVDKEDNEDSEDANKVESSEDNEDSGDNEDRKAYWSENEDRNQSEDSADYSQSHYGEEED